MVNAFEGMKTVFTEAHMLARYHNARGGLLVTNYALRLRLVAIVNRLELKS